ncbi:AMP-binding protein [Novosphingobium colocasiae]|uniref:AMP-binding protein n=1 Tax=Novosphingobium colocasiae TaxID=1256513 RepID=UPI0035B3C46E
MNANIFSAFAAAAAQAGDKTFVEEAGATHSYAQLLDMSARAAAVLSEHLAGGERRVLVQVEKSVPALWLYLGALRAGIVYIPLNTAYTAAELDYFLSDAQPGLFVASAQTIDRLAQAGSIPAGTRTLALEADGDGPFADALGVAPPAPDVAQCAADDIAAILYTSGTTGRSKGAMLTHGNLLSNLRTLQEAWRWQADDVLVHALPIFHVHGLFVALHLAIAGGSTILFHRTFNADAVLADLPRASVLMGVPTYYVRLLKDERFTRDLAAGVRLFISGSAPLTEPVFNAFAERTGQAILERYGMTEALMITSNPYDGPRVAGTVGYPLDGVSARLAADTGAGEPGVLEITGPNIFTGYWRNPEKTAEAFTADGWFRTGDIATIADDGRVALVGRGSDLIISGGYNVYPKEIELIVDELDGVEEAAVVGVPHPDFGEAVIAVVVSRTGQTVDGDAIVAALREKIAAFKTPKRVIVVDQLPRNAMGKVEKAALRRHYAALFD